MAAEVENQDADLLATRRTRSAVNMIQVAQLLARTEERLVDTERELIEAVRRTILVTEGMIALVRSTTETTQTLMAPLRGLKLKGGACGGSCTKASLHCACKRVAMAKDLVRVVQGLNHTAGSLNEATDYLIKLSNSLSPREELAGSCVGYLASKLESAEAAMLSIRQVQDSLRRRSQCLGAAAESLGADEDVDAEAVPEREQAVNDLRAMAAGADNAVKELSCTADTLRSSAGFVKDVLQELKCLDGVQVCPEAGGLLLDQLECPVCYQATTPPALWTCVNGHVVCASCRSGVVTCPTCRGPLSLRPAVLLTAWASALRSWCPYRHRGCAGLLSLADRAKHHEACEHRGGSDADQLAEMGLVPACVDRVTGEIITAIEETPVPASDVSARCVEPAPPAAAARTPSPAPTPRPSPAPSPSLPSDAPAEQLQGSRESLTGNPHAEPQRKKLRTRRKIFPCCVM